MNGVPSFGAQSTAPNNHYYKKLPEHPIHPKHRDSEWDSPSNRDFSDSDLATTDSSEGSEVSNQRPLDARISQVQMKSVQVRSPGPKRNLPPKPVASQLRSSDHDSLDSSLNLSTNSGSGSLTDLKIPSPRPLVDPISHAQGSNSGEKQPFKMGLKKGVKNIGLGNQSKESLYGRSLQQKPSVPVSSAVSPKTVTVESEVVYPEEKKYQLRDVTAEERQEIDKRLALHPEFTQKYKITRIQKVIDPEFEALFDLIKAKLNRATSKILNGEWGTQERELREKIEQSINSLAIKDRNVRVLTAFHGTKKAFLFDILESGIHFIGGRDPGYFGQGPYASTDPQYCAKYGGEKGDGIIFIVDLVFRRLYPVAPCENFERKPIMPGFDGHAIRVVPISDRDNEMVYNSCQPWDEKNEDKKIYHEIAVRDHSQVLIRYVMEYTLDESYASYHTWTRNNLRESIFDYLDKYPTSDLFIVLHQLLDEIDDSLDQNLPSKEMDLLIHLQQSLKDNGKTQINLGEIQKFLRKNDNTPTQVPYVREQIELEAQDKNLKKGDAFFAEGNYQKALDEYKITLKRYPHCFRAHVGCGRCYTNMKDWDKGILHFKEVPKFDADALRDCVTALINTNNLENVETAIKLLKAELEKDPSNLEILGRLAFIYLRKDRIKEAYTFAVKALANDSNYAPALRIRGVYYYYACFDTKLGASSYEKARQDLSKQNHPLALFHLTRLYIAMNWVQAAQQTCDLYLASDPNNITGLMVRAKVALMQTKLEQAEEDIIKCEKAGKDEFVIPALRGELYLLQEKLSDALEHFNKSIEIYRSWRDKKILKRKDHIEFYYVLLLHAKVHLRRNSTKIALEDYSEAINLFPDRPEAYKDRAEVYNHWQTSDLAQEDERKATELELVLNTK